MSRPGWAWVRALGGAAIVGVLVWRVGAGPFVEGVRTIDGWSLVAAVGIAVPTTVCHAWRWSLVARGLGIHVPLPAAVAACYRSQFLNATLPGGVVGDVHRGVAHGLDVGDVGRGLRAVVWERFAGQMVQVVLAAVVLLLLPSPVRSVMPWVVLTVLAAAAVTVALLRALPRHGGSLRARSLRTAATDVRKGLLARRVWPGIVFASTLAVAGYAATFLVAAHAAGSTLSPARMLPLALLVLLAMAVPLNVAGWGPREGVAAWAFSLAGLSAARGVTTAVVYGVMVLAASLPGAAVLVVTWLHRQPPDSADPSSATTPEGVAHG